MSIYFPDGKGGRKLIGTGSGGGGSYADATTTTSGLMSASDKAKLDGINPSQLATKSDLETVTADYILPTASQTVKGGVTIDESQGVGINGSTLNIPFYESRNVTSNDNSYIEHRFQMPSGLINMNAPLAGEEGGRLVASGNGNGTGGYIWLNGGSGGGNGGSIRLNGGTGGGNGGSIELKGGTNGKGGVIDMSGSTGGTIKGGVYFDGNPIFTGKPIFQNGATGLDIATISGATIPTATTSQSGLMSASDKSKLNGIDNNAQVNVIESVKVNGTALPVSNKAVNIDLSGKVDKVSGKQLSTEDYTTAEKQKLATIDTSKYVTIVSGKGLSTNDYTTAEKNKLNNLASITTAGENITISGGTIKAADTKYTLPTASTSTKGGIKVGTGLAMNGDTLNCTVVAGTTYTLPTASNSTKGGVIITGNDGLIMDGETLKANISNASTTKAGLMSKDDKIKLDGIDTSKYVTTVSGKQLSTNDYTNADKNKLTSLASITTAGENITITNGTIKAAAGGTTYTAGENITINNGVISATDTKYTAGSNITITGGTISAANTTYSDATTAKSGLMSAADKIKLNNLASITAAGENITIDGGTIKAANSTYILPIASTTTIGGVKPGNGLSIDSTGKLDVTISGVDGNKLTLTDGTNGGTISLGGGMRDNYQGEGGVIDFGQHGGTISGSPTFTGTPTFLNGANGISGGGSATISSNDVYIPTTAFDSIMANFTA